MIKNKKIRSFIQFFKDIVPFLKSDVMFIDYEGLSAIKRRVIIFFKWFELVADSFLKNHCMLRASALTYTTFLSIVPFLAVAFSILKGFGFQKTDFIRNILFKVTNSGDMTDQIINSINNANVSALGAIGVGTLLFTVISLLGNIEKSFNSIWGIKKGRTLGRKVTDYLSVTLIAPFFFMVAISATASMQLTNQPVLRAILDIPAVKFILSFIPYFFIGLVLTFIYSFLTNTTVKLKPALAGGLIAGALWQIAQWGFIRFQVAVAKSTALYQKFAPLFIFFLWVYISWVIVLIGSVMCFAFQNFRTFQKEAGALKISNEEKQKLAVKILLLLTRNFESEGDPLTNEEISGSLNIPVKLVNQILFVFEKFKVVIEIKKEGGEYFSLIRPPEKIFFSDVVSYLDLYKEEDIKAPSDKEYKYITGVFDKMNEIVKKSSYNLSLKDILARVK